jgi:hypothetical protein
VLDGRVWYKDMARYLVSRDLERREAGKAETGHVIFKNNGFEVLMA